MAAGTNNYEIVTRISPRVPRRYINDSAAVELSAVDAPDAAERSAIGSPDAGQATP
ncbi:alanine racemase [Arthrobacter sp. Hiyo4]|nr:alanine racemase [Arthrobacter sp. Hiyo4]